MGKQAVLECWAALERSCYDEENQTEDYEVVCFAPDLVSQFEVISSKGAQFVTAVLLKLDMEGFSDLNISRVSDLKVCNSYLPAPTTSVGSSSATMPNHLPTALVCPLRAESGDRGEMLAPDRRAGEGRVREDFERPSGDGSNRSAQRLLARPRHAPTIVRRRFSARAQRSNFPEHPPRRALRAPGRGPGKSD